MNIIDFALRANAAGISTLPPAQDGSKRPDAPTWHQYQKIRADTEQIQSWYANGRTGVGWVTGAVSGNLEVMDFDDRPALEDYRRLIKEAGLADLLAKVEAGYLERSPHGAHLAYRCSEISGNTKLANAANKKARIETRGEGGFIIMAPTYGDVNPDGVYEMLSGSIETIETITPDERKALHDVARMLDESIKPVERSRPSSSVSYLNRPGDDFNVRSTWDEVLSPHGWVIVSKQGDVTSWRRPGKDRGISATTNHNGSDLLYVFSTSTDFEAERGYSKFSAYTIIEHNGDFASSARELASQNYGVELPNDVDLTLILGSAPGYDPQPLEDLLHVPGLVGQLTEWFTDSAIKPQPILALGAAVAAMGTLLGQRVMTQTRLRSNIYTLGVGETGCGKDRPRQAISTLFAEIGATETLGGSFASDAAVETAVATNPVSLYLWDEIGMFLGLTKAENTPGYIKSIISVLLKMYSSSDGVYYRRCYADAERNKDLAIYGPCLSIYGTTVPQNFYGSLQSENLSDGLLSRFLVFESNDPDPFLKIGESINSGPKSGIVEDARRLFTDRGKGGDLRPDPQMVQATKGAWSVFDRLETALRQKRQDIRKSGGNQGPYTRVWATAQKLALIRACGIKASPEIDEADAKWGADLAWVLTMAFLDKVRRNVADNRTEANVNKVANLVRKAGETGLTKSQVTRMTRSMTRRERDESIATALESGDIRSEQVKVGTKQKATVFFCLQV